jgi:hypothetical protein
LDFRIIDERGNPNYYGRLEVRKQGIWGYVKGFKSDETRN